MSYCVDEALAAHPTVCCNHTPPPNHSVDFVSHNTSAGAIWAGQGPPPPNPMVVERFQQVISQLFQQV